MAKKPTNAGDVEKFDPTAPADAQAEPAAAPEASQTIGQTLTDAEILAIADQIRARANTAAGSATAAGGTDSPADPATLLAEALKAKAEAEAEAAKLRTQNDMLIRASLGGPKTLDGLPVVRWLVKIEHAPGWVVEARSEFEAFDAYKQAVGILSTEHQPTCNRTAAPLGRAE